MNDMKSIVAFRSSRIHGKSTLEVYKKKKIQLKVKSDVKKFLEDDEHTRMAPGKKECITRKKCKMQKRYLNDDMKKLYLKFIATHNYAIGYSTFCKYRPFWIESERYVSVQKARELKFYC